LKEHSLPRSVDAKEGEKRWLGGQDFKKSSWDAVLRKEEKGSKKRKKENRRIGKWGQ